MKNTRKALGVGMRLTRKSYRRKLIMFGFSVFMSLALTATGFAAWVLSKDAVKNTEGQVQVGAVTEKTIEISDITFTKKDGNGAAIKSFLFEPAKDDSEGRVRWNGVDFENMDLTIQWTIVNYQLVGDYYVEFKLPAGIYNAIEEGYITLSDSFTDTEKTETVDDETYHIFKMDLPKDVKTSRNNDAVLN